MQFKEINFYKIEDFLYFFDQLISNYSERERLFILENIHANTCQIFQKKDIDVIFDIKLRELIINSELLKISKEILQTNKLIYWGESGFQFNKPAVRGCHKDDPINTLRNKFNDTFQIRIAIYFHSSKKLGWG